MRDIALLLNVRAVAFFKNVFAWQWQTVLKNLSSLVIFGGFAVSVFFLARASTAYLLQQAHIGQFLFHRFLSMLLYVFFITVNLGNIIVCYATLYRSDEVTFLLGLPVAHEKIFLIKFIDNFFYSSSTLTLLGLAMLLGYGSLFHLPWYYYFLGMFGVFFPLMLIAAILAVMLLMGLIRVASRIGIRWLLAAIILGYVGVIYLYFHMTNPIQMVQEVMKHYPNVNEYFGYLDPPFVHYLPNHWVSEIMYWAVIGKPARGIPSFFLLMATLAGLTFCVAVVARVYYYRSWSTASDARAMEGTRSGRIRLRLFEFGARRLASPQADVLLRRDFWTFLREPSQWLHLILMVMLIIIFLVSMNSLELRMTQPFLQAISNTVVFLFNWFLIAAASLRFVFPVISMEGEAFWCVRSAPVSLKRLYWYKFFFSFALTFTVGEALALLSAGLFRDNRVLIWLSAGSTAFIALAITGLNLGAGAYFATFREKNPIRISSSQGASLTFLGVMVYLGVVVTILIVPVNRYFERLIFKGISSSSWIAAPLMAIGLLSTGLFVASSWMGLRSIGRDI